MKTNVNAISQFVEFLKDYNLVYGGDCECPFAKLTEDSEYYGHQIDENGWYTVEEIEKMYSVNLNIIKKLK